MRQGKKRTHWMWFFFPQLRGLGLSETAWYYGIEDMDKAKHYLKDPILGARLKTCCECLLEGDCQDAIEIFGEIDATKENFELLPRSLFYDYLYVNALSQEQNAELAERLLGYRVFTDIMFNPSTGKSRRYNTQARSCAIFVSLVKRGILSDALESVSAFERLVAYPDETLGTLF